MFYGEIRKYQFLSGKTITLLWGIHWTCLEKIYLDAKPTNDIYNTWSYKIEQTMPLFTSPNDVLTDEATCRFCNPFHLPMQQTLAVTHEMRSVSLPSNSVKNINFTFQ